MWDHCQKACTAVYKRVLMHVQVVLELSVELLAVVDKKSRVLSWGSLSLDIDQRSVKAGGQIIAASAAEFGLLHLLISRRNLPMTKETIMAWLFGPEHGRDLRQVDMFVARLRQSLAACGLASLIQTVSGRGYAVMDHQGDAATHTQPHGWKMVAPAW